LQNGARPEEIAGANAMAKEAYAAYQLVASGPRLESKNAATASRKAAESAFNLADENFKRMSTLHERHVISSQEFDTARNQFESAKERFNAAKEDEQAMLTGSRAEEIQAAQARYIQTQQQAQLVRNGSRAEDIAAQLAVIQGIRAQLTQMDDALDELTIKSPCNCVVSSLDLKAGQLVMANQNLASLTDLNDLWVKIYIPEEDFGKIVVGDEAYAQADAFPKITFHGAVTQLASRAEFTPRTVQTKKSRKLQVFGVKVALSNKDELLRPGMILDVQLKPKAKAGD
jgi:multidrug resistance efflux pump